MLPTGLISTSRANAPPRGSQILICTGATTAPLDLNVTPLAPPPAAEMLLPTASAGTACITVGLGTPLMSSTTHPELQPGALQVCPSLEGHTCTPTGVLSLTASLRA